MQILNIAGYKFIALINIEIFRDYLLELCKNLKGTILLSPEGINLNLAGAKADVDTFKNELKQDARFTDLQFHETYSDTIPFKHLKVKLKKEIITFRKPKVNVVEKRAPSIAPELFAEWLNENRDITILDTRNDYEVQFGTFTHAVNLALENFTEFPTSIKNVDPNKPVVMFCTGGIRCEKAALYMLEQGFAQVYQLEGGILGYFAKVGGKHYEGECFVFDERVALDTNLNHTETVQCQRCQGPVTKDQQALPSYVPGVSCPRCQTI